MQDELLEGEHSRHVRGILAEVRLMVPRSRLEQARALLGTPVSDEDLAAEAEAAVSAGADPDALPIGQTPEAD
ncbi:MAG: hypothetical protein HY858_14475 [Candidatus Solibacter usitatus]|nr:hypothetical protein [Candidatus Solibacter usitatus]